MHRLLSTCLLTVLIMGGNSEEKLKPCRSTSRSMFGSFSSAVNDARRVICQREYKCYGDHFCRKPTPNNECVDGSLCVLQQTCYTDNICRTKPKVNVCVEDACPLNHTCYGDNMCRQTPVDRACVEDFLCPLNQTCYTNNICRPVRKCRMKKLDSVGFSSFVADISLKPLCETKAVFVGKCPAGLKCSEDHFCYRVQVEIPSASKDLDA